MTYGWSYLSSFICLTWLSVGGPIFVAVTEHDIGVHTHRRTVPINANFWSRVQHPRPYCTTITSGSVPLQVLYLPRCLSVWQILLVLLKLFNHHCHFVISTTGGVKWVGVAIYGEILCNQEVAVQLTFCLDLSFYLYLSLYCHYF